jgi:hypothetical protein
MDKPKKSVPNGSSSLAERKTQPRRSGLDVRGMLSLATLIVSMSALTVAMGGGGKLVLDILSEGLENNLDGLWAKIITLGLAYFFGWVFGLLSIRAFGNLVFPLIIKIYAWVCIAGVSYLYIEIIKRLFKQSYDTPRFWAYWLIMIGGIIVLIGLHLLIEDNDLRPYAIPLMIISVVQLFVIVFRYVFTNDADEMKLWGDLFFFLSMVSISGLMLAHLGILSPLRAQIDGLFNKNGDDSGRGAGNENKQH